MLGFAAAHALGQALDAFEQGAHGLRGLARRQGFEGRSGLARRSDRGIARWGRRLAGRLSFLRGGRHGRWIARGLARRLAPAATTAPPAAAAIDSPGRGFTAG